MTVLKRKLFFTVAVLVLTTSQVSASGQARVRFAKGRTSATVSGAIARNATKCFVLGTRQGQSLAGTLSSRSGKVQFPWHSGAGAYKGGTSYNTITDGGDEQLCIENLGKATTFTLTVSIR
jgi:hypothetical protein